MRFSMYPAPWPGVIADVEAAGHEYVDDLELAEFLVFNGGPGQVPDPMPDGIEFVQFVYSGIDALLAVGDIRQDSDGRPRWANAAGVYAEPVAETAMGLLIAALHMHKVASMAASFDAQRIIAKNAGSLHGRTVAIIGAGGIGRALIPKLRAFGTRIIAVNYSGFHVDGADETVPFDRIDEVWPRAEALVLAAPLTDATRGLIDAAVLEALPSDAVVVNVGRGELIVTDDLVAALDDLTIAAAGLDVTDPEPLPEEHPLWDTPNCVITPHIAATAATAKRLIGPVIVAAAAAFKAGEKLPAEVDVARGY